MFPSIINSLLIRPSLTSVSSTKDSVALQIPETLPDGNSINLVTLKLHFVIVNVLRIDYFPCDIYGIFRLQYIVIVAEKPNKFCLA
jgi:hypothetical protein